MHLDGGVTGYLICVSMYFVKYLQISFLLLLLSPSKYFRNIFKLVSKRGFLDSVEFPQQ